MICSFSSHLHCWWLMMVTQCCYVEVGGESPQPLRTLRREQLGAYTAMHMNTYSFLPAHSPNVNFFHSWMTLRLQKNSLYLTLSIRT